MCRTSRNEVAIQKEKECKLVEEVEAARDRINIIQVELETVVEQLGEAKVSRCVCVVISLSQ